MKIFWGLLPSSSMMSHGYATSGFGTWFVCPNFFMFLEYVLYSSRLVKICQFDIEKSSCRLEAWWPQRVILVDLYGRPTKYNYNHFGGPAYTFWPYELLLRNTGLEHRHSTTRPRMLSQAAGKNCVSVYRHGISCRDTHNKQKIDNKNLRNM